MSIGRNARCHCGSGKKYKNCCMAVDRGAGMAGLIPSEARELASQAEYWEADLLPLNIGFEGEPAARPTLALVTADDVILHAVPHSRSPSEPEDVAAGIEAALLASARIVGALPPAVRVRHDEVAEALRPLLAARDVKVAAVAALEGLDPVFRDFAASMTGREVDVRLSAPETWAGWGLPPEQVAEIFRAAAVFYRAAPWTWLDNLQLLDARLPDGRSWAACVLGNAGQEFGLALYSDPDDFRDGVGAHSAGAFFADVAGRILWISFDPASSLPRPMRKEVAAAGWEIAGPKAFPLLFTMNTPAGGISRREAADLALLLHSIARMAEEHGEDLAQGRDVDWHDPDTGVRLLHEGLDSPDDAPTWEPIARLAEAGPAGPNARPEAALATPEDPDTFADREKEIVERFRAALLESGLSETTVEKHAGSGYLFVDCLARWEGVPVRAVTEYDLRVFLYDWYPRQVRDTRTRSLAVPSSLRRFFAYLADAEGIVCPWADDVLRDKAAFQERWESYSGGFWWDEDVQEWRSELYTDLHGRVMLHDRGLGPRDLWSETMGPDEALLDHELQRRWLLWRDEAIRGGTAVPAQVRAGLVERQRAWEAQPHPAHGGESPLEVIEAERRRRERTAQ